MIAPAGRRGARRDDDICCDARAAERALSALRCREYHDAQRVARERQRGGIVDDDYCHIRRRYAARRQWRRRHYADYMIAPALRKDGAYGVTRAVAASERYRH